MYLVENAKKAEKVGKEAIHSGHFMVSHFEAEAQDDDEIAVPIPDIPLKDANEKAVISNVIMDHFFLDKRPQALSIETSLSKLFQCMSIAYRQKLTSPKWNRFRGIRLRWKDKIRLNNVIWRCWHMQFIKKQNTLICQFASPLEVDTHNKPEAIVLEGKYWKRKLEAVTAEYKKWRMFYKNQSLGHQKDPNDLFLEMELLKYDLQYSENMGMLIDEDYMGLMSDTLFSTISNQPFPFPDTREIAKAGLAHFIQPSLGPLQPNLSNNEFMDLDHLDLLNGKLPTVPEEHSGEPMFNNKLGWSYPDIDLLSGNSTTMQVNNTNIMEQQYQTVHNMDASVQNNRHQIYSNDVIMQQPNTIYMSRPSQNSPSFGNSSVISKCLKMKDEHQEAMYTNYQMNDISANTVMAVESMQLPDRREYKVFEQSQSSPSEGFRVAPPIGTKYASQQDGAPRTQIQNQPTPMITNSTKFQQTKDDKSGSGRRSIHKNRRSRSNTREPMKRPPLQTAISDPSLITPANNLILSQLLTNGSDSLYSRTVQTPSTTHEPTRCKEETSHQICILAHPSNTSPVIITPVNITTVQKASDIVLQTNVTPNTSYIDSNSQSPTSPNGSIESLNREPNHRENRRAGHIHAEQKRRYNIKNGFETLSSLIPHVNHNPNAKLSKAALLQKGAEYIMQLRSEREHLKDEMDSLRQQVDSLTIAISNCQSLLPATGAPVSRRRDTKMQEMFDEYVRMRTMENWKFWIFSLLFQPLLGSFNNFVSTSNLEDLYKSTYHWVEQHCTLVDLRPVVFNSLKSLCTKTDILSDPARLPEDARRQVISGQSSSQQ